MRKVIFKKFNTDVLVFFITSLVILSSIVWTIQAVNYLDFVTEDGHGFKVYFFYTLFNLPKIIHRILPFVYFISIFYILIHYENSNQLNIFWINGISKLKLIHQILIISLIIMFVQIILGAGISPYSQNKAKNFLKSSDINLFSSLIKKGKFLDISQGLTIFIEKKFNNNIYENIFFDDSTKDNSKIIIANSGSLLDNKNKKFLNFKDGQLVDLSNTDLKIFEFSEINFLIDNLSSSASKPLKIQELNTATLLSCLSKFNIFSDKTYKCDKNLNNVIKQELLKRLYKPVYIPIIALFCCLLLFNISNNKYQLSIFMITFLILIFSEVFLRYSVKSNILFFLYLALPVVIFYLTYWITFKFIKDV